MNDGYSLKEICERLDNIEALIRNLVKQKMSNKQERLMDEVMRKGRMDVNQVQNLFNISRPWVLCLMKKLGKEMGFRFSKGDATKRIASTIVYDDSILIKDQNQKIKEILSVNNKITFFDLINVLGKSIEEIRLIANSFVESNPEYEIVDNNKIVRKGDH